MADTASSRRMDDQLLLVIDETSDWAVNGRAGVVLARYHSLRDAVRAVYEYEAAGHRVFAVCKQPGDTVILFREQIERVALTGGILVLPNHRGQWPARDAQPPSLLPHSPGTPAGRA